MAEPAAAAADAAQGVADTAKQGVGMARRGVGWTFNQLHPFGVNGKLGRTFKATATAALVGSGVVLTGGAAAAAALPFGTALGTTMTAAAAGASGSAAVTGLAANTVAAGTTLATSGIASGGFMGTAASVGLDFAAHAANGVYFGGSEAIEFGKNVWANADWNTMQQGLSTFQTGLTGP